MRILVTYDVETMSPEGQKRLRKVAKACQNYGQRVQNSVFECVLTEIQFLELKTILVKTLDAENDSIRIYHLPTRNSKVVEVLGKESAYNPEGILII